MNSTPVNFSHLSDDFLKTEIEAAQKSIHEKSNWIALIQSELYQRSIKDAPFRVGDRVCNTLNPCYQWDITHIIPFTEAGAARYKFKGIRIKKDGEPYKHKPLEIFSIHGHELSLVK